MKNKLFHNSRKDRKLCSAVDQGFCSSCPPPLSEGMSGGGAPDRLFYKIFGYQLTQGSWSGRLVILASDRVTHKCVREFWVIVGTSVGGGGGGGEIKNKDPNIGVNRHFFLSKRAQKS